MNFTYANNYVWDSIFFPKDSVLLIYGLFVLLGLVYYIDSKQTSDKKGDKRRGEALVVNAEAYLLGKKEEREKNLKIIKIWDNKVDTLVNDLIEEIKQSSPIKESEKWKK